MVAFEGGTSRAREIMFNAILGLVIALVSFITLRLINPGLVSGFDIGLPPLENGATSAPIELFICPVNPGNPPASLAVCTATCGVPCQKK
jgi:hypothetical protein